jgi:hypothetical protein
MCSTECAFILNGQALKLRLNFFCPVFTAELFALSKPLEAVGYLQPRQFMLCQTLNVIQGVQFPDLTNRLILERCTACHALSDVSLGTGHVGIGGNEAANAAARDATVPGILAPGVLSLYFETSLSRCILAKWQRDWDHTLGNKMQDVKPVVLHGSLLAVPSTVTKLW